MMQNVLIAGGQVQAVGATLGRRNTHVMVGCQCDSPNAWLKCSVRFFDYMGVAAGVSRSLEFRSNSEPDPYALQPFPFEDWPRIYGASSDLDVEIPEDAAIYAVDVKAPDGRWIVTPRSCRLENVEPDECSGSTIVLR